MPPKKKKEESAVVKEKPATKSTEIPLTEVTKEYYHIQIRDLENRLHKYQVKCDELSIISKEIEEKYNQLVQDRKDIVDYLKKSLDEKQNDIKDLQDKLTGQHQMNEAENAAHSKQVQEMQEEFSNMHDRLSSEIEVLTCKLTALEEFRLQKEKFEDDFAELQQKLELQEKDHSSTLYLLERKAVVDKDRLKKEMMHRVKTVAEEFRRVSNKQMADTVKRNIRENVAFSDQLGKMGMAVKELIQENDALRKKEKKSKIEIEILQATQNELARKNSNGLKILRMVVDKAEDQGAQLFELHSKDQDYVKLDVEADSTKEEIADLRDQIDNYRKELASARSSFNATQAENERLNGLNEKLEDLLSSSAYTLKEVLTEKPEDDEADIIFKRQTMIERLLVVLDSAAILGKAPPPKDFLIQKGKVVMGPLLESTKHKNQHSSVLGKLDHFPHYKLGDLGLVPRPRPKLVTSRQFARNSSIPLPASYISRAEMSTPSALGKLPSVKQPGV